MSGGVEGYSRELCQVCGGPLRDELLIHDDPCESDAWAMSTFSEGWSASDQARWGLPWSPATPA